jgi:hypothetical protein
MTKKIKPKPKNKIYILFCHSFLVKSIFLWYNIIGEVAGARQKDFEKQPNGRFSGGLVLL